MPRPDGTRIATPNSRVLADFVARGAGVALAALAGVMAAPGSNIIVVVFAVVVIGGMGSILGAIVGATTCTGGRPAAGQARVARSLRRVLTLPGAVSTIGRAINPRHCARRKAVKNKRTAARSGPTKEEKPMKLDSVLHASPVVALAALLLAGAPALADNDDGRSAETLLHLIKKARLVDLSHTWDKHSPIASVNPTFSMQLEATHANTRPNFDGHLSFTSEVMHWSGQHGAPSIDAIGHIGVDGKLFKGVDAIASTSNLDGIGASGFGANLAIDRFPKDLLITRGVLLDVARLLQKDGSPLPANCSNLPNLCEITAAHLERAAKRQGVKIKRGDTVFIRTGWGQLFTDVATFAGGFSPGPSLGGADWLIKQGARIVGSDTLTFEKRPPIAGTPGRPDFRLFPVHVRLIAENGVYIIENLDLEELSRLRAYEFVVVIPPLKIRGGTGSALRAFALVTEKRRDRDD